MRTKFPAFHFILSLFTVVQTNAQMKLIHFWDFNTTVAGDSLGNSTNPLLPSYTRLSTHNPKIVYSRPYSLNMRNDSIVDNGAGGSFYYDYSSVNYNYFNSSDSSTANNYLKVRNPSAGAYLFFYIPTLTYKNITFSYALSASSNKAPNTVFSYSTNGGSTWNVLTSAMDTFNTGSRMHPDTLINADTTTIASHWRPVSINFSSDNKTNNCVGFILRMTSSGPNDTLHSGNLRLDNITVMGDTDITTGINETANLSTGYTIYPNPSTDILNILSENYSGNKRITIYNVLGQTVIETENSEKQTMINTTALKAGVYFVEIKELNTGKKQTFKIVQE